MLRDTLVFRMVQFRKLCLTIKLAMRRVSVRCVPRLTLSDQMGQRAKRCRKYCQEYNDQGDVFLNQVVTFDETLKHLFLEQKVTNNAQFGSILLRHHRQKR